MTGCVACYHAGRTILPSPLRSRRRSAWNVVVFLSSGDQRERPLYVNKLQLGCGPIVDQQCPRTAGRGTGLGGGSTGTPDTVGCGPATTKLFSFCLRSI